MGKIKRFEITFKNKDGVCFAGSPLEGALVLELASKLKVKGLYVRSTAKVIYGREKLRKKEKPEIRLRFHGYALVHWTERHSTGTGKNKRQISKHYNGEELYFDHTVVIFGLYVRSTAKVVYGREKLRKKQEPGSRTENCETFDPGVHTFPFEFYVPEACPTSYEGSWGRIRYYVLATLEKMWAVNNFIVRGFSVVNEFDLNQDARSQECIGAENEMTLCCMCCKSGPIIAQLTLDYVGFVPGEGIPIRAEITNHSSRHIASFGASLQMVVKYNAIKKTKTHCNVVASISKNDIKSKEKSVIWSGDRLIVPAVPPSHVTGCGIIDISYILELSVNPSGPSFQLPVKVEVLIGTVPLKNVSRKTPSPLEEGPSVVSFSKIQTSALSNNEIQVDNNDQEEKEDILRTLDIPVSGMTQQGTETVLDNIPVMSFMESVLGTVTLEDFDSEKIGGQVKFTPMYPYFGSSHSNANFDAKKKTNGNGDVILNDG